MAAEIEKNCTRQRVWKELRKVAVPDSRFHYDFGSFICDFEGSRDAVQTLLDECAAAFRAGNVVFITPDNCLETLRYEALRRGIRVLTTTYGIRRGFFLLDPTRIDAADYKYASTLDGMEKNGEAYDLSHIIEKGLQVESLVTGTGAINAIGARLGKGHGYFDLEWAMLFSIKAIAPGASVVAVVHDSQVLDEELELEVFDTVCDLIITPTRVLRSHGAKPQCGILWDKLQPGMLEDIPPLQELKAM